VQKVFSIIVVDSSQISSNFVTFTFIRLKADTNPTSSDGCAVPAVTFRGLVDPNQAKRRH
jgi:hypothetical protein